MPDSLLSLETLKKLKNSKVLECDPKQARELLAKAMKKNNLHTLPRLSLKIHNGSPHLKTLEMIQFQLKKNLGLNIDIETSDWPQFLSQLDQGEFDIYFLSWMSSYYSSLEFLEIWTTNHPLNRMGFQSKKYDSIIEKIKRSPLVKSEPEIESLIKVLTQDELPLFPLVKETKEQLLKSSWSNVPRLDLHRYDFSKVE